ncbi:MAG: hypothetical protein IJI14_12050 [Anaerolineaceae bacterium]|nr:hypothetical protein [Anaerolineaceae bacterium]
MQRKITKPEYDGEEKFTGWSTVFETDLTLPEYFILSWIENREQFLLTLIVISHFIRDLAIVIYLLSSRGAS